MPTLIQLISDFTLKIYDGGGSPLLVELRCSLIDAIQLDIGCIDTDGGVDGQRGHKFSPSPCEYPDELDKFPFPNGPCKKFDDDLFPDTASSGNEKSKPGLYSLEVRVASICTFFDVSCHSFAEILHPSFDCLTIGPDLLGIIYIS